MLQAIIEHVQCLGKLSVSVTAALEALAFALGGQAGSRHVHQLHGMCSGQTLLRLIRRAARSGTGQWWPAEIVVCGRQQSALHVGKWHYVYHSTELVERHAFS